jgi:hypothetical protein
VGTVSNRDAVGARLEVIGGKGPAPALQVTGGGSYLSHSDRRLHVVLSESAGAPALVPQRLRVRWPSGVVQEVELTGAEREIRVVEAGAVPAEAAGTPAGGAT